MRAGRLAVTRRATLMVLGAFAASCLRDASGPGAGRGARLALVPTFDGGPASVVDFDRVRVTVLRVASNEALASRTAADTVIPFPAGADSVELTLLVPLEAPSETFQVFIRFVTAAGDTVFRNDPYPQEVVAYAGSRSALVEATLIYVGVGAGAASVVITNVATLVSFGNVLDLTATALDAAGQPIPGTPIGWFSLDPARVRVPDVGLGRVLGGAERGPARIVARLPTGLADTVLITAQPLPSLLKIVSGDNQQGVPGLPLPLPLRVQVLGPDGLGVAQAPVRFRSLIAGGLPSDSVVISDPNGFAETVVTLPLVPVVAPVFEATIAGVPSVAFGGLAPANIAQVLVTPAGTSLDALLATVPFTAEARDAGGKVIPTAFVWTSSDPAVAVVDPATGLARVIGNGIATITATAGGVAGTAQLDVFQRVVQLVFGTQPGNTTAGVPISPVEVRALDPGGSIARNYTRDVTLGLTGCPATLLGTTIVTAVQGVATFPDLRVVEACSGLRLRAASDTLTSPDSDSFTVLPGPASQLVYLVQPGGVQLLQPITPPVQVAAQDQYGNLATQWASPITVAIGINPVGALLGGVITRSPVGGMATFDDLTLDLLAVGFTLVASSGALPPVESTPFSVSP